MILSVKNVSKAYPVYRNRFDKLLDLFFGKKQKEKFVLENINFEVKKGESIALIGQNGAGKSTLLKIIAKTLKASSGDIKINGSVASILELGIGLHGELSGRDNVYQICSLMGFSKSKIDSLMDHIRDFSELGEYFDDLVLKYSSGMQVRLAFSIVTATRPDILIIDEALSVGDVYFQHKSFKRIRDFKELGTTLIIVSHDAEAVKGICDRAILLHNGKILKDSVPGVVFDYYNALIAKKEHEHIIQTNTQNTVTTNCGNKKAVFENIKLLNENNEEIKIIRVGQKIKLSAICKLHEDLESLVFGYQIKNNLSQIIFGTNSFFYQKEIKNAKNGQKYEINVEFDANFGVGNYAITVAIHSNKNHLENNYDWIDNAIIFSVINENKNDFIGVSYIDTKINMELISE